MRTCVLQKNHQIGIKSVFFFALKKKQNAIPKYPLRMPRRTRTLRPRPHDQTACEAPETLRKDRKRLARTKKENSVLGTGTVAQSPSVHHWQNDTPRPKITLLIQLAAIHTLPAVLRNIRRQFMRAILAKTKAVRITYVHLTHLFARLTKAKDRLPDRAQQMIVLATTHGHMEV
jgi:hypothetical protein